MTQLGTPMPAYSFLQWQNAGSLAPSLRQSPATGVPCPDCLSTWAVRWSVYRGFFPGSHPPALCGPHSGQLLNCDAHRQPKAGPVNSWMEAAARGP
jgi:hypothetical protein